MWRRGFAFASPVALVPMSRVCGHPRSRVVLVSLCLWRFWFLFVCGAFGFSLSVALLASLLLLASSFACYFCVAFSVSALLASLLLLATLALSVVLFGEGLQYRLAHHCEQAVEPVARALKCNRSCSNAWLVTVSRLWSPWRAPSNATVPAVTLGSSL